MDPVKEAFFKIKEDISVLKNEIRNLNLKLNNIEASQQSNNPTHIQTTPTENNNPTIQQSNNPTHIQTTPTHNNTIQPLYNKNITTSIGNEGVPTNTQTHQQTYTQTHQHTQNTFNLDFREANNILESLDTVKKEIRLKFKQLTPQEMLVFSVLYTLEEQKHTEITYKIIAKQLKLSESSIRDYINKLINKGIPIDKTKQNNKTIILKISQDLKNIATLTTIQSLREL